MKARLGATVVIFAIAAAPLAAAPAGPGFTYQGWLQQGGVPVTGAVDLRFGLWDAAAGGSQLGAEIEIGDVAATEGVFTVILNAAGEFGAGAFDGAARWLEIGARPGGSSGSYATLTPRQELTPAPYALHAAGPWKASGADLVYEAGSIGIGTPAPTAKLDVTDGRIRLRDSGSGDRWDMFQSGGDFLLQQNASHTNFVVTSGAEGKVGIGGQPPHHRLRVSGGPLWTAGGWIGSIELDNVSAIGWRNNSSAVSFGIGQTNGGLYIFRVADQPGSTASSPVYEVIMDDFGRIGMGAAPSAAAKLKVQTPGAPGQLAAVFEGDVFVNGNLGKSSGSFKIDHPLDPANKYLSHSFVESPDMLNVYNGNAVTGPTGRAEVALPEYFSALNKDFRYQLTVIDGEDSEEFVQAKIAKEIAGNRFTIRTSRPNTKVSWQVTGVRQDAWANAHRIKVEEEKPEGERGRYLAPELFGQADADAIGGGQ